MAQSNAIKAAKVIKIIINTTKNTEPVASSAKSVYIYPILMTHQTQKSRRPVEGGCREVLFVALPLIFSTSSLTIQHFVDRIFLSWYSREAIAASMPAGLLNFTFMALFIGTAATVGTFVAQYSGAGMDHRIGPVVWQGFYFAFLAGLVSLVLHPLAPALFSIANHSPRVREFEIAYFQILVFGAFPVTAASALAGFFNGLGKTVIVMVVSFVETGVNVLLDYILIFGHWGFPRMGVEGAALGTVLSQVAGFLIYLGLILRSEYAERFRTRTGWKPDRLLLLRFLRFGLPSGVHFFLELIGFSLFIQFVGRFGTDVLAAANISFNINNLAFMPMIGFGTAVSVLVGRRLGQNRPDLAEKSVWSAFRMTIAYTATFALAYALVPKVFLIPYASNADPESFSAVSKTAILFLKFVAVYALFDAMSLVFSAAVKGAGDTRFAMAVSVSLSWTCMVIPGYLAAFVFHAGILWMWFFLSLYISVLGIVFLLRFLRGKWKTLRVIERVPDSLDVHMTHIPNPKPEMAPPH